MERGAGADLTLRPHPSAVAMNDALDGRESDPGPREVGRRMQPLERREQLVRKGHVEPGTVVADEERARAGIVDLANFDPGRRHVLRKLPRVGE
ncbi:MAG: hypothetical protein H0V17_27040 [Deltaproteobacteria bacterium]|nr:hypothetical protein [Deltaproteobacteria bacterium]